MYICIKLRLLTCSGNVGLSSELNEGHYSFYNIYIYICIKLRILTCWGNVGLSFGVNECHIYIYIYISNILYVYMY